MNLGDFQTLVSTSLKRGTTLDTLIPAKVVMAVQWLERNYTFKYMEQFRLMQIVATTRTVEMPTQVFIKAMKFLRIVNADGSFTYLNKIEPEDMQSLRSTANQMNNTASPVVPSAYYMIGNKTLVFDAVPSEDLSGEGIMYVYSSWPTDSASEHPLLDIAADLLLAQTLMYMAVFDLKDPRMLAEYKAMRDEAVNTLTRAADEEKYGGEGISMAFVP